MEGLDYYNSLDYCGQRLYVEIKDKSEKLSEKSDVLPFEYTIEEFTKVVRAVKADNPELFYVDFASCSLSSGMHKSRVKLEYLAKPAEIAVMKTTLDELADKLVAAVDGMNDFETEAAMHDYITQHSSVSSDGVFASSAYGALIIGKADAEGYSLAMKLLSNRAGLYCSLAYGEAGSGKALPHVWNLVSNDGVYFYTDVTFDDADAAYSPTLRFHGYFNLSQVLISADHRLDGELSWLPAANTDDTYYNTLGLYAADESELAGVIMTALSGAYRSGRCYIEFSTGFSGDDDTLKQAVLAQIALFNGSIAENGDGTGIRYSAGCRIYRASKINNAVTVELFYSE